MSFHSLDMAAVFLSLKDNGALLMLAAIRRSLVQSDFFAVNVRNRDIWVAQQVKQIPAGRKSSMLEPVRRPIARCSHISDYKTHDFATSRTSRMNSYSRSLFAYRDRLGRCGNSGARCEFNRGENYDYGRRFIDSLIKRIAT